MTSPQTAGARSTTRIKFCGLTRPNDAALARDLGASYVGVIFAGGPRVLTPDRARAVLDAATAESGPAAPARVGVVGTQTPDEIAECVSAAGLDVVQLHSDPDADDVDRVRRYFGGAVWGVLRLENATLPPHAVALARAADAVVLDRRVDGTPWGGTGVTLDWTALAPALDALRRATTLILAGGLRPENVTDAVAILAPDAVDVASGVEAAPGVKDHDRMRRFADAVASARAGNIATRGDRPVQ